MNETEEDDSSLGLIRERLKERYKEYVADLLKHSPKILLVGPSGIGKSSCINIVFGLKLGDKNAALIDHAEPCTKNFHMYGPTKSSPVRIIDSKGIEVLTVQQQFDEILGYIDKQKNDSPEEHVHLVYYFAPMSRWQEADTKLVNKIRKKVGVVIVINKCDIRKDEEIRAIRRIIERELGVMNVAECGDPRGTSHWIPERCPKGHTEILASRKNKFWSCEFLLYENEEGEEIFCPETGDDSPYGHKELVRMSLEELPELVRSSFMSAQRVDLDHQHKLAAATIVASVGSAVTTATTPLPFSDLIPLFLIESGMAASLMAIYGMPFTSLDARGFVTLNAAVIGVGGMLGKSVSAFLKTNVGYVAGATMDAAIAGTVVFTIGIAISVALTRHVKNGTIRNEHNIHIWSDATEIIRNVDAKELFVTVYQRSTDRQSAIASMISSTASNVKL